MLDIQFIRDNPEVVREKAAQKLVDVDVTALLAIDEQRRALQTSIEALQRERNEISSATKGQRPSEEQIEQGRVLKEKITQGEEQLKTIELEFYNMLRRIPNMPTHDTPVGKSEDDNVVVKTWGEPTQFDFEPKSHVELGAQLDLIDKERAAKVSGARFTYLKGVLVQLQFALLNWATQQLSDPAVIQRIISDNGLNVSAKPFTPVLPPPLIRTEVYEQTARLNGAETTYKLEDDDLWLNASAEHSLCGMYKDEILAEEQLPIRYVGYSTSFRREAGTYGKDMEGILRMHHFDKLEMESFSTPDQGPDEHLFLVAVQEYLMQQLRLPYQVMLKCTADIGDPNARGVDINTWLPGQNKYRETHSADFISDYQARRLRTRVRRKDGIIQLVHTNDATAFAMGRTLIAIMENYQTADGHIRVPEVLQPFIGGRELV